MWRFFLFILLVAALCCPTPIQAQALRWERSFGGLGGAGLFRGKATADGGYVLAGLTGDGRNNAVSDSVRGNLDLWVVKFSSQGSKQWDRRYGGDNIDEAFEIVQTTDGGYFVGCATISGQSGDHAQPSRGLYDYWALRLDAQGNKLWEYRFGTDTDDYLNNAFQTSDGGFILAGTSGVATMLGDQSQPTHGETDFWVVKLDSQGHKLWDRTLGGNDAELLQGATPTADGGCLLGGGTFSSQNGDVTEPSIGAVSEQDYWVVKLDASGATQWQHRYGGLESDIALALLQNADGTYYVAGVSRSGVGGNRTEPSRGGQDFWVLKMTAQGAIIWDRRFGTPGNDAISYNLLPRAGGGCVLTGFSDGPDGGDKTTPGKGQRDYWILRLDAAGNKVWDQTYGGNQDDAPRNLVSLANQGILVVGNSFSSQSGDQTQPLPVGTIGGGWLVTLDSMGIKQGTQLLTSAPDETQRQVLRTRDGGVLAGGYGLSAEGLDKSSFTAGLPQIWLLKRDSLGMAQWDVALGLDRGEYLASTQELPDRTLLVAGTARVATTGNNARNDAAFLAYRLSATGTELWRQEWGGPGEDWLVELRSTADGGYALGGTSRSGIGDDKTEPNRGSADFWLLKLAASRAKQWDHRFGGSGLDSLVSVRQTADNGYLLAGSTTSPAGGDLTEPSRGGADYWLVKVNSLGILQWQHRYGGPGHDWLAAVRPTADGGILLLGTTTSALGGDLTEPARGGRDLWLVKVNNLGVIEWQRRYGGSGQDYAATLELDPDGGFIIGAYTSSPLSGDLTEPSRGGTDYWLLRLGSTGGLLWQNRFGGSGEDLLTSLTTTRGYGYALGGTSNSPIGSGEHQQASRGGYDYWTLLLGARRVPGPLITTFSPALGLPGTVVTITGSNFTGTGRVEFNDLAAPGFVVNATGTSITVTLPAGASTGLITVWANGAGSSATPFVVPTNLVISSAQSVQGTYNNVTVTGPTTGGVGVGTLMGPLTVLGSLTVQEGGSLITACQPLTGSGSFTLAAGGTLGICHPAGLSGSAATDAVQFTGSRSFSPDANYRYNGTQAQTTGDGLPAQVRNLVVQNSAGLTLTQAVAVAQVLRLTQGDLATNGHLLTLLSSAAGTALVDNTGGVVLGTATVQRFVSPILNPGPGYRHFSAPTSNATVASLATTGFTPVVNPAYNSSATPGLVTPFPTVYGYAQDRLPASPATAYTPFERGWESPAQLTDALTVGRGYTVQLPANRTVQFTGPLNNGPLPVTLDRATATPALTTETGWHLVGNPYPSPLDWRLLNRPATIDDACYVFQSTGPYTGQYRAYVNGFGPALLIGSGQGFFVRVNTPGATPTLTFINAARLTTFGTEPALLRSTADPRPRLRLALVSATGPADTTIVYFEAGATAGPDTRFDADKLANPSGLSLATLAGARPLAIDGRPLLTSQPLTIPLQVSVPRPGAYTFTAAELTQFDAGTHIYLLDALTGTRQLLAAGTSYPATLATTTAPGRFALEFRPAVPTATAAQALAEQVQLWPNPATGSVRVLLPATLTATAISVIDALGREVLRQPLTSTPLDLPVAQPARGVYQLRLLGVSAPGRPTRLILE